MEIEITVMGFVVGILVGLTGVGGAALLTPILLMIGVNPAVAVGTDLMYNSITKLFGTIQHWRQKTVKTKIVRYLAYGSIPGAITSILMLQLFESFFNNQETIIKHALGVILIVVSILTLVRLFSERAFKSDVWQSRSDEEKKNTLIVIGFILGFIVGLTSIGSGSLFAVAILYFFRIKASELVGTDVAHAFLLVTVAGALHAGFQKHRLPAGRQFNFRLDPWCFNWKPCLNTPARQAVKSYSRGLNFPQRFKTALTCLIDSVTLGGQLSIWRHCYCFEGGKCSKT